MNKLIQYQVYNSGSKSMYVLHVDTADNDTNFTLARRLNDVLDGNTNHIRVDRSKLRISVAPYYVQHTAAPPRSLSTWRQWQVYRDDTFGRIHMIEYDLSEGREIFTAHTTLGLHMHVDAAKMRVTITDCDCKRE